MTVKSKYFLLVAIIFVWIGSYAQTPTVKPAFGSGAGNNVQVISSDTFYLWFTIGNDPVSNWQKFYAYGDTNELLLGMPYTYFYTSAFKGDPYISKGYFANYVELRWDLVRYDEYVERFRIYRKPLGSSEDSTLVAILSADQRVWQDEYCASGVLYKYTIYAEGIAPKPMKYVNYVEGIGFRMPVGFVSGRITYESGQAVEGVTVYAETDEPIATNSIYLPQQAYLSVPIPKSDSLRFVFDTAFAVQMWVLPDSGVVGGVLFSRGNQYKLVYLQRGMVAFIAGSDSLVLNFEQKQDTFFNITAVRSQDSLKLFVIYSQDEVYKVAKVVVSSALPDVSYLVFGRDYYGGGFYKGFIDEIRLWNKVYSDKEFVNMALRYLSGDEDGMVAYYRLNEGVGEYFFDLAHNDYDYFGVDGKIFGGSWEQRAPFAWQLGFKGITDAQGNYIISGIPYSTGGNIYRLTPVYDIHQFDPSSKDLYFGPESNTYTDVNFTDKTSFLVRGNVVYRGTRFPVEGVKVYVDGKLAYDARGIPVQTDAQGNFEVSVPIGLHYIEVRKEGHHFLNNGRFPPEPGTYYDFQEHLTLQQPFVDTTLIKLVGRVVGGPVEAAKPPILGRSKSNLGNPVITLTTKKGFDLSDKDNDSSGTWQHLMWRDDSLMSCGETNYLIRSSYPKEIKIYADPNTGEYVAWLLPEEYIVTDVRAGNYIFDESYHVTIDLRNAFDWKTSTDSAYKTTIANANGDVIDLYYHDSAKYNALQDFIYRVKPEIQVVAANGDSIFWEKVIYLPDDTVQVVDDNGNLLTPYPIFIQRKQYDLKIKVFERYINADRDNEQDLVPVTDGYVEIQNQLAINDFKQSFLIDNKGEVSYSFRGGLPNILGDYTKTMTIVAYTGENGSIITEWKPNGEPFKAYIFGGYPTGNNFISFGTIKLDFILRDPPGSQSYGYLEVGYTKRTTVTDLEVRGGEAGGYVTFNYGVEQKLTIGGNIGTGYIVTTEEIHNATLGLEGGRYFGYDKVYEEEISLTERWETGSTEDFVGPDADLFVGHTTNILYGLSVNVTLKPDDQCEDDCIQDSIPNYSIGTVKALRFSEKYGTYFMYTRAYIRDYIIPTLKWMRNQFLLNADNYTSVRDPSDPLFGEPNTTADTLEDGSVTNGDSYNYTIPSDWPDTVPFVDTVDFYNKLIKRWKKLLADDEETKAKAELVRNISYTAGPVYEFSEAVDTSWEFNDHVEWFISPYLATELGFSVNKHGLKVGVYSKGYVQYTTENISSEARDTVQGFVILDEDENDYISFDVKKDKYGFSYSVRGGQTQCPYEGEVPFEFYEDGSGVLSQATMQRQIPSILCENPIVVNVPENQMANFDIQIGNLSQAANNDQWFLIYVDEQSNPDGAAIYLDGTPVGNGRLIYIPQGEQLNKVISIKMTKPDVYDYENIGIILASPCEIEDIADTIYLTARFVPICTEVDILSPQENYVINTNTGDTLPVRIGNYNLNHSRFQKILFQYKPSSASQWITDAVFYVNEDDYLNASESNAYWINGQPEVLYNFDMSSLPDRKYDLRAMSVCYDQTTNPSEVVSGTKDTERPKVFGTPQPADGILTPGDEILITFNEPIQASLLTPYNFSVRGVLNQAQLKHSAGVYFDGVQGYMSVPTPVQIGYNSFTIEFWVKRQSLGKQTILAYGQDFEIGFDQQDKLWIKFGNEEFTSSEVFNSTDKWYHIAVSFDLDEHKFYAYVNDIWAISGQRVNSSFELTGKLYIGRDYFGLSYFNGFMHDLRVWLKTRTFGEIYGDMYVNLTGDEIGLVGLWKMDEARGDRARDYARNHHAYLIGANWVVFPSGYSVEFNGINSYVEIPLAPNVVIDLEADYTIEFWFKANEQANTVMFSTGTLGDPYPDSIYVLNIGFDENSYLYVQSKDRKLVVNDQVYCDGNWHHFAFVVNRQGNAYVYIDGELKTYTSAKYLGGLAGSYATIGAKRHYANNQVSYSQFFNGKIDEFRIWNSARTAKLIQLYINTKLKGDDFGLVAYYPFDAYNDLLQLVPTLDEQLEASTNSAQGEEIVFSPDQPNIKDVRPLQNLAFEWVANENQILIKLKEDPPVIEKTIVEISVKNVEDLYENRMISPVSWTAYINMNTVIWEQNYFSFQKEIGQPLSFKVKILNKGGKEENYQILNLPTWLTVDQPSGVLSPASEKELTFTVDPYLDIGNYEVTIYLASDFGYNEKLVLNLKVYKNPPDWDVNPIDYQYSMGVVAQVKIDGRFATNEDDIVYAFVGNECRGKANLQYVPEYDIFLVFLNIYSNNQQGDSVYFRIWNADEGIVHENVMPQIQFVRNQILGTPSNPLILETYNSYTNYLPMPAGWKWFSINVYTPTQNNLNAFLSSISPTEGDVIKGQTAFATYSPGIGWSGGLAQQGLSNKQMYMLKLSEPDTLIISGAKLNPMNVQIPIYTGWNWIAFTSHNYIRLEDAFSQYNPADGDIIKSQYEFAVYDSVMGWIGSLKYLIPGEGYMFKTSNPPGVLTFPETGITKIDETPKPFNPINISGWEFNPAQYQYNMSVIAELYKEGIPLDQDAVLGAFANAKCRGIAKPISYNGKKLYFLTIYANNSDTISFNAKLNNNFYSAQETIVFEPNSVLGSLAQPLVINLTEQRTFYELTAYPNPFNGSTTIQFSLESPQLVKIEIYDLLGRIVAEIYDGELSAGLWKFEFNAEDLSAGAYLLKLTVADQVFTKVLIKER